MHIKEGQWVILMVNVVLLLAFTSFYFSKENYEFLIYVGVILFFILLIGLTNTRVQYSNGVLWGLTLWGFLHMAGGSFIVQGKRLYEFILIPLSETYQILKFDQFVHIVGFCVATLVMYELLHSALHTNHRTRGALAVVVAMAGLGVGAFNEIIEFLITVVVPQTGVGGYVNTSLDLVADLVGALIALGIIWWRERG